MANEWESAPVVSSTSSDTKNEWENAPVVDENDSKQSIQQQSQEPTSWSEAAQQGVGHTIGNAIKSGPEMLGTAASPFISIDDKGAHAFPMAFGQGETPITGSNVLSNIEQSALGFSHGVMKNAISLANLATTPGRMAFNFLDPNSQNPQVPFSQNYQNFKQGMKSSEIPTPEWVQPENKQQLLGANMADLATMLVAPKSVPKEITEAKVVLPKQVGVPVGEAVNRVATTLEKKVLGFTPKDIKSGAEAANIPKYDLYGSPAEVANKSQGLISEANTELMNQIKSVKSDLTDPNSHVNMAKIMNNVQSKIENSTDLTPVHKQELISNFNDIKKQYESAYKLDFDNLDNTTNKVDLLAAQMEKRYVGKKGDWEELSAAKNGNSKLTIDSDLHNRMYDELKTELENKGGPGIKELNKKMSDLIPIERAAAKKAAAQGNKPLINFTDYLGALGAAAGGHIGAAVGVVGGNKFLSSGMPPKIINKASKIIKDEGIPIGKLGGVAIASQPMFRDNRQPDLNSISLDSLSQQ